MACAGLCGAVNGVGCIPALVRGYASVTGNGGHDGGQMMKYMIDPTVRQGTDPLKFNFDRDPSTTARASTIYNATSFPSSTR